MMSSLEITFADSKMRQRRTPGNQAHVTNAKDDPLQLAADAAVAVALGFDEVETTMRVASNGWANAMACAVGAAVGRAGVLFQCSIEEAEELKIGMAGFHPSQTVSVYGTEGAFVDGDDTRLVEGFPNCGLRFAPIKARCTSGASAELLMGFHEASRCFISKPAASACSAPWAFKGTQNGGIDGAPLTASMAGGMRELMAENLIAVWLGLECASGKRCARQRIRRSGWGAKITPFCSPAPTCSAPASARSAHMTTHSIHRCSMARRSRISCSSNAILRRTEASAGRRKRLEALRMHAIGAISCGLRGARPRARSGQLDVSAAAASGSTETDTFSTAETTRISEAIRDRGLTAVDVVRALARRG